MLPNAPFAARVVFFLIDVSLRTVVLVVLARLVCILLRRSSAAARYTAWALTLAALLCLPPLRALTPGLPAAVMPAAVSHTNGWLAAEVGPSSDSRSTTGPSSQAAEPAPSKLPARAAPTVPAKNQNMPPVASRVMLPRQVHNGEVTSPTAYPERRTDRLTLFLKALTLVWLAGICAVFARMAVGLASARLLVSRCHPVAAGPIAEYANEARRAMGVSIPVRLVVGDLADSVAVPMAYGFLRPMILLPADAGAWPADRLRVVLLHEMAHVRRRDWTVLALARCVCALYWFHPLVWLAAHRLRAEGERACDDLVLSCGVAAPDYAAHLLEIVRRLSIARRLRTGTVAMAGKSEVNERLQAILAGHQSRSAVTLRSVALSVASVAAVTVSLAALHPTAARPATAEPRGETPQPGAIAEPPPATVAAGETAQSPFTLIDITNVDARRGITTPSNVRTTLPALSVPIMASEGGMGLWIKVRGGVSFETLTPALDGRSHTYRFDGKTLTVSEKSASYSWDWTGADGVSRVPYREQPYTIWSGSTSVGSSVRPFLTLVPRQLSRQCRITAQPLSATGRPLGSAVDLICQPVSSGVLFTEIPDGYNSATKEMAVTAALVRSTGRTASWRLTHLPKSVAADDGGLSPAASVAYGPCVVQAAAIESEDLSGDPPSSDEHPARPAWGQWFYQPPLNADEHGWTGVPTIRLMMRTHNASSDYNHQNWMVRLDDMTPQWETSPGAAAAASPSVKPFNSFSLSNIRNAEPADQEWEQHDWQLGVAYPGQQHWVRVDGAMLRFAYHMETVTFHNAQVVQDGQLHVNRLVWSAPETETTPSGISVTVLNARPGTAAPQGGVAGSQYWRFEGAYAPLVMAWRLPAGFLLSAKAPWDAADMVDTPEVAGLPGSSGSDSAAAPDWSALAAPGQANADTFSRSGYQPICLAVAASTPLPNPEDEGDGVQFVPPPSSPHTLERITLTIRVREQQEIHPFHFLIPVGASFPRGWDPNEADGRSSSP